MFWSIKPDGQEQDQKAMHTGCPVLAGVKWNAFVWIHTAPFRPESFQGEGAPPSTETLNALVWIDTVPFRLDSFHEEGARTSP